jgi:hypothetical protein
MKIVINTTTEKILYATLTEVNLQADEIIVEVEASVLADNNYYNLETSTFYKVEEITEIECPLEVSLWKLRVILKLKGLEQNVANALENLDEPTKTAGLYIWNYGTTIDRDSQTINYLQAVLQLSKEQIDDIFINANLIKL